MSLCLLLTLLLLFPVRAAATTLHELANCRKTFSYSGSGAAYFYGFTGSKLVSSRVLPDILTRTTEVPGNILSACHNDDAVCALYQVSLHTYKAVQMNMHSGACTHTTVAANRSVQHSSIAAAADEVFVIVVDNDVSYALGTRGTTEFTYRFAQNIDRLFVSGNAAYARLDGGAVYRIGNGQSTAANGVAPQDSAPTVSAAGKTATLQADFSCTVRDTNAPQAIAFGDAITSDGFLAVAAGTTVRQLQARYDTPLTVSDTNGNRVDSGKLKTGDAVVTGGKTCLLAVLGDLNGTGTVNSADAAALMRHFTGSEALSSVAERAADFNRDGAADHRDLVLIARAAP